jgi:hypothetical protein
MSIDSKNNKKIKKAQSEEETFDFQGARFELHKAQDREILTFVFSQALYGEATGVFCGMSLYSAQSLEASKFYIRQAHQEMNHLRLFADIMKSLELKPTNGHWVLRLLSSHNHYYPLKVFMEHAIGEGLVLDIFKEVLLQTLPEHDEKYDMANIMKKLNMICKDEQEHVDWGERETKRLIQENPKLKTPLAGLLDIQLIIAPKIATQFSDPKHPVLKHLPEYVYFTTQRAKIQAETLGIVIPKTIWGRGWNMFCGSLLFIRSQFASSKPKLLQNYLKELDMN